MSQLKHNSLFLAGGLFLFLFFWGGTAEGAPYKTIETPLFSEESATVLDGKQSSAATYIDVLPYYQVSSKPMLTLHYSFSAQLDSKMSGITVFLNDKPLETIRLSPQQHNGQFSGKIEIPLKHLKPNRQKQKISIEASLYLTENECLDKGNKSLWVAIEPESKVTVSYEERMSEEASLNYFPYSLMPPTEPKDTDLQVNPYAVTKPSKPKITLVYPDEATSLDRTFLARSVSYFGRTLSLKPEDILVLKESEVKEPRSDLVFVGMIPHFSKQTMDRFGSVNWEVNEHTAVLATEKLHSQSNRRLYLLGAYNEQGMELAFQRISDNEYLSTLKGKTAYIQKSYTDVIVEKDKDEEQEANYEQTISLEDLGYDSNMLIENVSMGSMSITYQMPTGMVLEEGSKVILYHQYNDTYSEKFSNLIVTVNGVPVRTELLAEEAGEESNKIEITIPESELSAKHLTVALSYNFNDKESYSCAEDRRSNGWAKLSNVSYFKLKFKERHQNSFNYFPYPIVKDGKWNNLAFVIPDELEPEQVKLQTEPPAVQKQSMAESNHLQDLVGTILAFSQFVNGDDNQLYLYMNSELEEDDYTKRNIFIHGPWKQHQFLTENSHLFPFQVTDDLLKLNNEFELAELFAQEISIYNVQKSPWENDKFLMLLSTVNDTFVNNHYAYLSDDEKIKQLIFEHEKDFTEVNEDKRLIDTFLFGPKGSIIELYSSQNISMNEDKAVNEQLNKNRSSESNILMKVFQFLFLIFTIFMFVVIWTLEKKRKSND